MGCSGTSRGWILLSSGLLFGPIVACEPPDTASQVGEREVAGIAAMQQMEQMEVASYDAMLQVPLCNASSFGCDSDTLLDGRGPLGPEPHAPNTLGGTCLDGSAGTYHSDESIDRIRVYTTDGSALAPGKEITIEVSLWAYSAGNRVDLYAAEDATNPAWTLFKVLTPPGRGPSTLTATYTLPADIAGVQAIRAALRYTGASSSCDGVGYNDRDDLAFTVSVGSGCSEPMRP